MRTLSGMYRFTLIAIVSEANKVDARIVDYKGKKAWAVEMNCPWVENRGEKDEENTAKYSFL